SEHGVLRIAEQSSEHFIHAESLHPLLDELMISSQLNWSDIRAIAVSIGPGSYTGLRIGVSAAKGLAFGLGIPFIAIRTSEALAAYAMQKFPTMERIWSMIDARRMEVYRAPFDRNGDRVADESPLIVEDGFAAHEANAIVFVGDGAKKCAPFVRSQDVILDVLPSAAMLAPIALKKWNAGDFDALATCEPFYLKDYIPGVSSKNKLV
ncbi:MAG: tRNA (adenosine(37)-N6)-threonylcarbamoyltransferase complex dimerization subunit type 1 TsaB, partial [Flavobacteriales bacterium]